MSFDFSFDTNFSPLLRLTTPSTKKKLNPLNFPIAQLLSLSNKSPMRPLQRQWKKQKWDKDMVLAPNKNVSDIKSPINAMLARDIKPFKAVALVLTVI